MLFPSILKHFKGFGEVFNKALEKALGSATMARKIPFFSALVWLSLQRDARGFPARLDCVNLKGL